MVRFRGSKTEEVPDVMEVTETILELTPNSFLSGLF